MKKPEAITELRINIREPARKIQSGQRDSLVHIKHFTATSSSIEFDGMGTMCGEIPQLVGEITTLLEKATCSRCLKSAEERLTKQHTERRVSYGNLKEEWDKAVDSAVQDKLLWEHRDRRVIHPRR